MARPDADDVVRLMRPEVRAAHEYVVGSAPKVSVKLNQNESPLDVPDAIKRDLADALLGTALNRYPSEIPRTLRAELAARLDHPEEGIIIGNGSNELTYTLGMCFVGPATPVVLPRPMFSLYDAMVRLHGGQVVPVAPRPDLSFDVDGLLAAMDRTQAPLTVVTTPNNPTGLALSREDVVRLIEGAPGAIVVDEAYVEFNPHGTVADLIARYPNLLVMRTLSKAFGLAGLRLGFVLGQPRIIREMMKSRLPFMVDRVAEAAALSLLRHVDLVAGRARDIKRWTEELTLAMQDVDGVQVLPSDTNFVLFRTPLEPRAMMDRLAAEGILVRNMGGYPELRGYLRVSSGTEDENRLFLRALQRAIAEPVVG
ncbi:MAG: histidinol-phosphate transaminase [Rhodothermales bacterium]|nr:histidinol-phosphate transaminase [Rhodothermales bacterium]MBO6779079.1 histidinol-phosphate transaminase [Rhodothermales bacterium]